MGPKPGTEFKHIVRPLMNKDAAIPVLREISN